MVEFSYSRRSSVPRRIVYLTPVATIGLALLVGAIPLLLVGINPLEAYYLMSIDTVLSVSGISNVLIRFVSLLLTGLAVYFPMKAGFWNIGAEGQLYVGAVLGTYLALVLDFPALLLIPTIMVAGAIGGAFWGFIPGWLRAKLDVNEIITTLMFTFIAVNVTNYLLFGPLQAPGRGGLPSTDTIPVSAQLPRLPGTRIHLGILLALACLVFVYYVRNRSQFGYETSIFGSNPSAADFAGVSKHRVTVVTMAVGGALAGLAGIIEISGVHHQLVSEFSPGYGFTAIVIALLGRKGAHYVGLGSLFFAILFVGGSRVSLLLEMPSGIVDLLQALIVLFLITAVFFRQYQVHIEFGRTATGGDA
jgi:simple sugar transport system permease protein